VGGLPRYMSMDSEGETIQERRRKIAQIRGEPIETLSRTVYDHNGALYTNLPARASKMWDVDQGDDITVEVHDDRLVVRPEVDDEQ
jgi:hypothetical protein